MVVAGRMCRAAARTGYIGQPCELSVVLLARPTGVATQDTSRLTGTLHATQRMHLMSSCTRPTHLW